MVERFGNDFLSLNSSLAAVAFDYILFACADTMPSGSQAPRIRITVPPQNGASGATPPWENEIISRLMASGIADIQPAIGCSPVAAVPSSSFASAV